MASNFRTLLLQRAQREQELNTLVSAQHPIVRNFSGEMLSLPHIQRSAFYGFALRWPQTYIAYLFEVLSQSNRLPSALRSTGTPAPAPDPELQDQLMLFRTSALSHLNRLPAQYHSVLLPPAPPVEPDIVIFTELRTRLLANLYHLPHHTETDTWELAIPTAVDVALLRDEYARLVGTGVLPPMEETIRDFAQSRALDTAQNRGEARDPMAVVAPSSSVPEREQVFDFGTECTWCSAKLVQTSQEAADLPDWEPLRTLPCSHVVGAVCFEIAGDLKCPICRCLVGGTTTDSEWVLV
ncbi:hypothetical protein N0V82_005927 [Gnomoniopsis sp. IMI 355080]|nr:hypothetical protein N0V82_005927 [Gnomoniopsis sp. IMI 355080]